MGKDTPSFWQVLAITLWALPSSVLSGAVLVPLWRWFVVPLGVSSIGIWHATGIVLLIGFVTCAQPRPKKDSETWGEYMSEIMAQSVIWPLLIFALGFVMHLVMAS